MSTLPLMFDVTESKSSFFSVKIKQTILSKECLLSLSAEPDGQSVVRQHAGVPRGAGLP